MAPPKRQCRGATRYKHARLLWCTQGLAEVPRKRLHETTGEWDEGTPVAVRCTDNRILPRECYEGLCEQPNQRGVEGEHRWLCLAAVALEQKPGTSAGPQCLSATRLRAPPRARGCS